MCELKTLYHAREAENLVWNKSLIKCKNILVDTIDPVRNKIKRSGKDRNRNNLSIYLVKISLFQYNYNNLLQWKFLNSFILLFLKYTKYKSCKHI